jgi:soluble lytic murein transglycosylase-like protein
VPILDTCRFVATRCRRAAVGAALAAVLLLAGTALPAYAAATPAPSPNNAQLQTDLDQAVARLNQLNNQLQTSQASLDTLNRQLAADQAQEQVLQQRLADMARLEYEQPLFSLNTLLSARSVSQVLGTIAQARLMSGKQSDLVEQATQLRAREEKARDGAAAQLAQIKTAREEAARIAAKALASRDSALQSLAKQATNLACDPNGGSNACPTGSIQQIIIGAFTPLGGEAVQWGLRIAKCESGYNPRAVNPSGATGLFQFMPSTFANTPPGKAGGSIWDPTAQSQAAAWMYSQGRQGEWQCN